MPGRLRRAGDDEHGAGGFERASQHFVVRRAARDRLGQRGVLLAGAREHPFRRQPVGFRHQDVERDGGRTLAAYRVHELGHRAARPRPLADRREALLVDLDDGDRHRLRDARRESLVRVEPCRSQRRRYLRFTPDQDGECDKDGDADEADASGPARVRSGRRLRAHNSISMPSYAALTLRGVPDRVISSRRRVSASTASIAWSLCAGS